MNDDQLIKMNFDMAKKYYDCALSYSTNTEIDFVFDPFIVNLSFSCELSLKTIIYYEKIYAPEQIKQANHNLKTLFYMLGKNTRTNIKERIKQNNYRFDMEIKRAATIFCDIRYYYLNSLFKQPKSFKVGPIFLERFCEALLDEGKRIELEL